MEEKRFECENIFYKELDQLTCTLYLCEYIGLHWTTSQGYENEIHKAREEREGKLGTRIT